MCSEVSSVDQPMRPRVLVTGANGFVGQRLLGHLSGREYSVRGSVRSGNEADHRNSVVVGDLSATTDWSAALEGIDYVVHLAGIAHRPSGTVAAHRYHEVNADGTEALAKAAIEASVRRFVFVSTVKVFGEESRPGEPFGVTTVPSPSDDYAASKLAAEDKLKVLCESRGMEYVILRPPLIYGPGVRANFLALMNAVQRGLPLPFGGISNQRSLIFLDNLCDVIKLCLQHPNAGNRILLPADEKDLSTPELIELIANALEIKPRVFSCPRSVLTVLAAVTGRRAMLSRLLGCLQVEDDFLRYVLRWSPPTKTEQGIVATSKYLPEHRGRT